MEFSYIHQLILSAIFMLLISHTSAENAQSKLVEDICRSTAKLPSVKFEDCVGALQLDPRTPTANLTILAQISIQLGISNATETQTFVKNMANNSTTPAPLRKPLRTCLSWYEAVIMSFKSALEELDEDMLSANYDVKIAGDDALECEAELTRDKAKIPPLTARNYYALLYSSIGFVITDRLQ
ncbi:cell wall / vacuolar inhibitor of fructosidase 2 [Ricinus communis]|uniref:C, putative n=1 Tax=Ricinus communis TaxID=3988 RepID=B9SE94_RICCO|nr:cell wall / vacuolar inhibitor of fructosidase 2 [Ricinus communis]EEF38053.1 C, putative [Ricinus communis]|eukprot:XP_002524313.1 cell wall / vacuolar inhibitor of fructosidase 2 [Ricinus communis]